MKYLRIREVTTKYKEKQENQQGTGSIVDYKKKTKKQKHIEIIEMNKISEIHLGAKVQQKKITFFFVYFQNE